MLKRQTSGSVVCPSCGRLVGVNDERCLSCGKWNPGMWGFAPALNRLVRDLSFMEIVLGSCIALFVLSFLMGGQLASGGIFSLVTPDSSSNYRLGSSGAAPVFVAGRWWTVLSAAWLHGSLLHIAMNMMCLRQLMPAVAECFGTSRLVIIYTASSIAGFFLTSLMGYVTAGTNLPRLFHGATVTVGASAPLMGLCGALVLYGHRTGSRAMTQMIVRWVVILLVIGIFVPIMDNWAHLGGFAGGYLIARLLDPMREEKPGHSVAAIVCLLLSGLAVGLSFLAGPTFEQLDLLWRQFVNMRVYGVG